MAFALWMLWRRGGYIAIRRSRAYWGPHFLWSPDLKRWLHYAPREPVPKPWVFGDKWLFNGVIRRSDNGPD